MPKFEFRLEKVLEWYRMECQMERQRLAVCAAALSSIQQRIDRLHADSLKIERELITVSTITGSELVNLGYFRLHTKIKAAELDQERIRCEHEHKNQVLVVQAAERRSQLVGRLRERRLVEYLYAENRSLENLAAESHLSKWLAQQHASLLGLHAVRHTSSESAQ